MVDIANIAADQFKHRQRRAAEMRSAGTITQEAAIRHLRPWLAIACLCGAQLPELDDGIASYRTMQLVHGEKPSTITEPMARQLLAADICPRADWVKVLAAARVVTLDSYLPGAPPVSEQARRTGEQLLALASFLAVDSNGRHHIPPYQARAAAAAQRAA